MIGNLGQVWKVEAPAVGSALALSQAIGRGYRLVEDRIDGIYREAIDYFETEQGTAASIFKSGFAILLQVPLITRCKHFVVRVARPIRLMRAAST